MTKTIEAPRSPADDRWKRTILRTAASVMLEIAEDSRSGRYTELYDALRERLDDEGRHMLSKLDTVVGERLCEVEDRALLKVAGAT